MNRASVTDGTTSEGEKRYTVISNKQLENKNLKITFTISFKIQNT